MDLNVYDGVLWSMVGILGESVARGSVRVDVPDLTGGRWRQAVPTPSNGRFARHSQTDRHTRAHSAFRTQRTAIPIRRFSTTALEKLCAINAAEPLVSLQDPTPPPP